MFITVISDGSYCPRTKITGYAFWIASNRGSISGSGVVPVEVPTSLVAEMYSMINAIIGGLSQGIIHKTDTVLIQNDCLPALTILMTEGLPNIKSKAKAAAIEAHRYFYSIVNDNELNVTFRHVKGHSNKIGARYTANRHCDVEARAQMRSHRDDGFTPRKYIPKHYKRNRK